MARAAEAHSRKSVSGCGTTEVVPFCASPPQARVGSDDGRGFGQLEVNLADSAFHIHAQGDGGFP